MSEYPGGWMNERDIEKKPFYLVTNDCEEAIGRQSSFARSCIERDRVVHASPPEENWWQHKVAVILR